MSHDTQFNFRRTSSISLPRALAKSLLVPMRINPHFSSTRKEAVLEASTRAETGRSWMRERKAESALVAMPRPQ